jgi:hypothetical protein
VQQRPAGGQRVGRGAGGRGDDQAVGALVGHEVAVDLHPQSTMPDVAPRFTTTSFMASAVEHALVVALHSRVHQRALVFSYLAGQHGRQHGGVLVRSGCRC